MGRLGRGLASLIPKREKENAEDMLDRIDAMDVDENEEYSISVTKKETVVPESVEVKEEIISKTKVTGFSGFEEDEIVQPPSKPLVTPLTFDPFEETSSPIQEKKQVNVTMLDLNDDAFELEGEAPEEEEKPILAKVKVSEEVKVTAEAEPETEDFEEELSNEPVVQEEAPEEVIEKPEEVEAPTPAPEVAKVKQKAPAMVDPIVMSEKEMKEEMEHEEAFTPSFSEPEARIWDKHEQHVEHIPIGDIHINPLQPRRTFDPRELEDLASSIEQHGILQPLVVRRLSGDKGYELIAGERRLRSATKLGWDKVPCVIRRDVKSDQSRLVFALIENIQRENLNPIEEAMAYDQLNKEYGLTHEEIGQRVGKSRVGITNICRVLQLPAEIQRGLIEGKISVGHAKAILMIPDEEKQIRFYQHLLDEGLTVRKTEIRARRIQRSMNLNDPLRQNHRNKHPLAIKYTPVLEEHYGYNAKVRYMAEKNNFEIVFRAHNEQEVQQLVGRLLGQEALPEKDLDKDVIED